MDLQISVFLLFLIFSAGHSLQCFECGIKTDSCVNQTAITCPAGSCCQTSSGEIQDGDFTAKGTSKSCDSDCESWSYNYGYARITKSCCNTDLCNLPDPPDPVPNGKKCYTCNEKSCWKTLSCTGDEDHCLTITANVDGQLMVRKGCIHKSLCNATSDVQSISCCEGNLCNGAQSVTQSFLFLCCSLLSYFLLH
ncbi:hypothetical protein PO909_023066 [Leuciscus waleckii]